METNLSFVNPDKELLENRPGGLYKTNDVRSPYYRDYTRILHSNAYRRLKHKTQVFYNIGNDHVCTRIEHVQHVESVSYSIARGLNLDTELTRAIACGHDLGHAPFGHEGETVINERLIKELSEEYKKTNYPDFDFTAAKLPKIFWHERNGLRFVDKIELLPNPDDDLINLNLTYAVRDGIISHCGEVDQNGIIPRSEYIDLYDIRQSGLLQPYTWEGCVVKLSDKIAYIGRDIEDAFALGFLDKNDRDELYKLAHKYNLKETINTTSLMHDLITDIIKNSTPDKGLTLSDETSEFFNEIKKYNYEHIYYSKRFEVYKNYVRLVLNSIYDILLEGYDGANSLNKLNRIHGSVYKMLVGDFIDYACKYVEKDVIDNIQASKSQDYVRFKNNKIYGLFNTKDDYIWAVTDFISGMTDKYAISLFDEMITLS